MSSFIAWVVILILVFLISSLLERLLGRVAAFFRRKKQDR